MLSEKYISFPNSKLDKFFKKRSSYFFLNVDRRVRFLLSLMVLMLSFGFFSVVFFSSLIFYQPLIMSGKLILEQRLCRGSVLCWTLNVRIYKVFSVICRRIYSIVQSCLLINTGPLPAALLPSPSSL